MSHMNYTHNEHIQEIDSIEFSVYGNDEVTDYSVINSANNKDPYGINLAELYDGLEPKRNGLVDGRLGTTRIHDNCEFCELRELFMINLDEKHMDLMCSGKVEKEYPAGETIIKEGTLIQDFTYLKSGNVNILLKCF